MRRFLCRPASPVGGFSLLELSIVITIISIVAVMGLELSAAFLSNTAYQNTQATAATVDAALVKYRMVFGHLPCPASLTLSVTDANYGVGNCGTATSVTGGITYVSVGNGGSGYTDGGSGSGTFNVTFTGGHGSNAAATAHIDGNGALQYITIDSPGYGYQASDTPSVNLSAGTPGSGASATANISAITVGALPIRDLSLPLVDALDGFSGKFFYYVSTNLTTAANFGVSEGVIQVRSGPLLEPCTGNCTISANGAAYAIISTGRDQRGAYSRRGSKKNDCLLTISNQSAIDSQNCFFEGSSVAAALNQPQSLGVIYNSPFNNGAQTSNYTDDVVITRMKSDL